MPSKTLSAEYLYETVANDIKTLITSGTYRPGDRLPSVRQLSRQKRISVSTALQAYMLLESRGLVEARPQSGYYVRQRTFTPPPEPEISSPASDPTQVSLEELAFMTLRDTENPNLVKLGIALPDPDLLPTKKLLRIIAGLKGGKERQANAYVFPPGYEPLRVQIAQRAHLAGISLAPSDLVITSGCLDAVDLCLRAVCQTGDIVAIDSPTHFGLLQCLEGLGLKALEIPTHPREGISLSALRFALDHNPVRAVVLVSNFNNPLGCLMSDDNKRELVKMLAARDIPLIEDDIFGEMSFSDQRPTACKAFDEKGLVLWCSSFSKDIAPGFRVGWCAPGRHQTKVEWLKFVSSEGTAAITQVALAELLATGGMDYHLRRLRRLYAFNLEQVSLQVMRSFPEGTRLTRPTGGFLLWVQLPEGCDSLQLYKRALVEGITLAPGYLFSATPRYAGFIRLCTATWNHAVEQAITRLGALVVEGQAAQPAGRRRAE